MIRKGLASHTEKIIEQISQLDCIKPFVLVGGTALSLQLNTRLSEDLDFMRWKENKEDNLDIGWHLIKKQLESIGKVEDVNVAGFDQVSFVVSGVRVSFYAAPRKRISSMREIPYLNNIRLADVNSIGVMKMEALMRRNKFRDYYDIYSILRNGSDINKLIPLALVHSGHQLKTKNLVSMLTNGELFRRDEQFAQLHPIYDVKAADIERYIKATLFTSHILYASRVSTNQYKDVSDILNRTLSYAEEYATNKGLHKGFKWLSDSYNELCQLLREKYVKNDFERHNVSHFILSQCKEILSSDQLENLNKSMMDIPVGESESHLKR